MCYFVIFFNFILRKIKGQKKYLQCTDGYQEKTKKKSRFLKTNCQTFLWQICINASFPDLHFSHPKFVAAWILPANLHNRPIQWGRDKANCILSIYTRVLYSKPSNVFCALMHHLPVGHVFCWCWFLLCFDHAALLCSRKKKIIKIEKKNWFSKEFLNEILKYIIQELQKIKIK